MSNNRAVYGIDLGTTYSCIAQIDKYDQPTILRNFEGDNTTPSAVYFDSAEHVVVGKEAKDLLATEPDKTVILIKRQIGIDEAFDKANNTLPYHYDPAEISGFILKKLVKDANDLGDNPEPIKDVVITCPAYFGTKERVQTKQAGAAAGLNVLAIINEPTAAAISYGLKTDQKKSVLVYDLGGGTFDVTIINVNGGAIKVIATGGDHHLGGIDWDTLLAEYMLAAFNEANGTSYTLEDNAELKYTLLLEAELKKKLLTAKENVRANIQYDGMSARIEITRDTFESLTQNLLNDTLDMTQKVIDIAKQKGYNNIDEFLLVGGSSKMPQVKRALDERFGCDAKLNEPDECVAKGAAIYAMNAAYADAIEKYENGEIDEKPQPLRTDRTVVVNVTSKTYGTSLVNEQVGNIIFANTSLPINLTKTFYTVYDNQTGVELDVYESDFTNPEEHETVDRKFCTCVHKHTMPLKGQYPKGTEVQLTYKIDNEGILSISVLVAQKEKTDFELHISGIKNAEELQRSIELVAKAIVE